MTFLEVEETAGADHIVPADLLDLYEVLEYNGAVQAPVVPRTLLRGLPTPVPGTVISRVQWGARAPKSKYTALSDKRGSTAHYEGPHMGIFPHESCPAKVRGIQAFHMDSRGWNDIAYSTLTCPHGEIFMCRGDARTAAQGTNLGNATHYAHCILMGVDDVLTEAAKFALRAAFRMAREQWGAGDEEKVHSDWHATGCPGDPIRKFVRSGMGGSEPVPDIPLPPDVSTGTLKEKQVRLTINVQMDAAGNGWRDTDVPWTDYRSVSAQGLDPQDAKAYKNPIVTAHDRGGKTRVVVTGWLPTTDPKKPMYCTVHINRQSN